MLALCHQTAQSCLEELISRMQMHTNPVANTSIATADTSQLIDPRALLLISALGVGGAGGAAGGIAGVSKVLTTQFSALGGRGGG